MGAKTWMFVSSDGDARQRLEARPTLDREATTRLAAALFPKERLLPLEDTSLLWTSPPDSELVIGSFAGVDVIAAKEFGLDDPTLLDRRFLEHARGRTAYVHAMHSVVDWCAYAVWRKGQLVRAFSASPESGIIVDEGAQLPFEVPYRSGAHPAAEPGEEYPFEFHPLELAEAALGSFFGYQIEGAVSDTTLDPESIPLMRFKRQRMLLGFIPW